MCFSPDFLYMDWENIFVAYIVIPKKYMLVISVIIKCQQINRLLIFVHVKKI